LKKLNKGWIVYVVNETWQISESLEPVIDLLALVVRKLWPKINKLIREFPRD